MTYLELANFILKKMPKEYRDLDVAGSVSWGLEGEGSLNGNLTQVSITYPCTGPNVGEVLPILEFSE
jgi:hypothetical protein|tara:strand:+ start:800 stop:1000 length:201 start_codon:yes stop_codon:yes gene_type:complete